MRKTRELAMQVLFLWDSNANVDLTLGWQATDVGEPDSYASFWWQHVGDLIALLEKRGNRSPQRLSSLPVWRR